MPPAPARSLFAQPCAFLQPSPLPRHADEEALQAFQDLSRLEGIIPALETSHALAFLNTLCPTVPDGTRIVLNCSGRGDKDVTVGWQAGPSAWGNARLQRHKRICLPIVLARARGAVATCALG